MTLKTELPQICSYQLLQFSNKPKLYQPTRIPSTKNYTANDHKLPTTVSVPKENFSLAESAPYQQELASYNTPSQEEI
jgi:hypothetical protein